MDKSNVFVSMAFFRKVFDERAARHPDIDSAHHYVDADALDLVRNPWEFDVMVTENMLGDILSDLAAALVGGMGMAPSADIGDEHPLFQPAHGSAPDITGRGIANPIATIQPAAMKLEDQHHLGRELNALNEATPTLSDDDARAIRALGEHFASVWNGARCPMTLKKRIARTLIEEVMVDLDESAQELHMVVHWHGGFHAAFNMPKPLSGAVAHKTALEDVELIAKMARRYRDDQIARVLSKLGRRTGKGNRWTQPRVATVRRKYAIAPPDVADLDPDIVTLGKATEHTGVSDTTIMRLIDANILPATQVAPYAPLEIRRTDLDSAPVAGILKRLKETGKLVLDGVASGEQASLFEANQ